MTRGGTFPVGSGDVPLSHTRGVPTVSDTPVTTGMTSGVTMECHRPERCRPAWLPAEGRIVAVPAGEWWDAATTAGRLGDGVWHRLRRLAPDGGGPVLRDARAVGGRRWFLVPVGTAATWQERGSKAFGKCSSVSMPVSLDVPTAGIHWVSRPDTGPELVDAGLLRQAVAAARDGRP